MWFLMQDIIFTLGECESKGKKYRFVYNCGCYGIFIVNGEELQPVETFDVSREAYDKWNSIKRPEKARKSL